MTKSIQLPLSNKLCCASDNFLVHRLIFFIILFRGSFYLRVEIRYEVVQHLWLHLVLQTIARARSLGGLILWQEDFERSETQESWRDSHHDCTLLFDWIA